MLRGITILYSEIKMRQVPVAFINLAHFQALMAFPA
jgi:hypothetical protein